MNEPSSHIQSTEVLSTPVLSLEVLSTHSLSPYQPEPSCARTPRLDLAGAMTSWLTGSGLEPGWPSPQNSSLTIVPGRAGAAVKRCPRRRVSSLASAVPHQTQEDGHEH